MTMTPREYIASKRKEISERMQQLRVELAELDRMESALSPMPPLDSGPDLVAQLEGDHGITVIPSTAAPIKKRRFIEGGIKSAVMGVLVAKTPRGLTSQEILEALKAKGIFLPRTSLSPQLSRLKKDTDIELNEGVWTATSKGVGAWLFEKN